LSESVLLWTSFRCLFHYSSVSSGIILSSDDKIEPKFSDKKTLKTTRISRPDAWQSSSDPVQSSC